jgi:hypothetical protein
MMNEKEFNAERKRQIRLLIKHSTPKERWQIRRNMVKRRLFRLVRKVFKAVTTVLIGVIGLRAGKY